MADLLLPIDTSRGRRAGLEAALRRDILSGRLPAGTALPSSRALAAELGWARATVVGAFEQLIAEGYLVARHGSGTEVASVHTPPAIATPGPSADRARIVADFRPGEPDRGSFPRSQWLAATRRVLSAAPDPVFGYGDAQGLPELRGVLASYLVRARGVVCDPQQVVIVDRFAGGLAVIAAALIAAGIRTVAVENPGLPYHAGVLSSAGLNVVAIDVDDDGIDVTALGRTRARAVLVTPAHQYPVGVPLASSRRVALVDWAHAVGGYVLEDDYDGEFRYDRRALTTIQGLAPDVVVYGGTASKTLAAGLGIGWLVLPPPLLEPVLAAKNRRVLSSNLEQAVLAEFIASGRLDRHVRRMRLEYRRRRDSLITALGRAAPWLDVGGVAAGLHVTAYLPASVDDGDVAASALQKGIALAPLSAHATGPARVSGLVLGYSRPPAHAFTAALRRLSRFLATTPRS